MKPSASVNLVDQALAADGVPLLVPKKTAAEVLHVHPRTIERMIATRQLRAIRTSAQGSGRILIPRAALAAMLASLGAGDSYLPPVREGA